MAIVFNPFSGTFDFSGSGGGSSGFSFSFKEISDGNQVAIDQGQQMVVDGDIMVNGDLNVEGEVFQIPDFSKWAFFWTTIPVNESIRVPANRLMFYLSPFMVDGNLFVEGQLSEVN
jgi:hypothetical protein